jgi:hypothetical protein
MMILHEWLGDHADNARVVRDANRLLHTKEVMTLDSAELGRRLEVLGPPPYVMVLRDAGTYPWGRLGPGETATITVSKVPSYMAI